MSIDSDLFYVIQAWQWAGRSAEELKRAMVECWEQAARENMKHDLETLRKR